MSRNHQSPTRKEIEAAAHRLGASRWATFKWRARGIPSEWRIRLYEDGSTNFTFKDLEQFKPKKEGGK